MTNSNRQRRLRDLGVLQAALGLLGMLVLFWLRRRAQQQLREDRPLAWRRNTEMGPTETAAPAEVHIIAPPDEPAIEIENVPEVSAGDGSAVEQVEMEETASQQTSAGRAQPLEFEGEPVEGPPPSPETQGEPVTPAGDDLEIVEGIGPKINSILQQAGIRTFAHLAATEVEQLQSVLRAAGLRNISNPQTWPEQARLAAEGEWSKLEALQKQLKGGRK